MKISKTSIALGNSQEDQIEADICLATMEAYCNVLYYSQLADIYKAQVEVAEESLTKARRQEELGQKGHADVVEMDSNLADKQYQLVEANNKLNDAKITLEDVMFWSEDHELVIDTELPVALDSERMLTDSLALEDMVDFAQANNPAARVARYNLLNAKRELSTARWQLLPSLNAYAGWSTTYFTYPGSGSASDPFRTQFKNNGGEYVQLSLNIPIFSGLQRHSNEGHLRRGAQGCPGSRRSVGRLYSGAEKIRCAGGSIFIEYEKVGAGVNLSDRVPDRIEQLP